MLLEQSLGDAGQRRPVAEVFARLAPISADAAEVIKVHLTLAQRLGREFRYRFTPFLAWAQTMNPRVPGPNLSLGELLRLVYVRDKPRRRTRLDLLPDYSSEDPRDLIATAIEAIVESYRECAPSDERSGETPVARFMHKIAPLLNGWNPSEAATAGVRAELERRAAQKRGHGFDHVVFDEFLHSPTENDTHPHKADPEEALRSLKKMVGIDGVTFLRAYGESSSVRQAARSTSISESTGKRILATARRGRPHNPISGFPHIQYIAISH
jgi:hypothetical protein